LPHASKTQLTLPTCNLKRGYVTPKTATPGTTVSAPDIVNNISPFGQILSTLSPSGQVGDIRVGQFSLRLEF
jgi:hypothetical protein